MRTAPHAPIVLLDLFILIISVDERTLLSSWQYNATPPPPPDRPTLTTKFLPSRFGARGEDSARVGLNATSQSNGNVWMLSVVLHSVKFALCVVGHRTKRFPLNDQSLNYAHRGGGGRACVRVAAQVNNPVIINNNRRSRKIISYKSQLPPLASQLP